MTELEVLYKLERAYSRKWWEFWVTPYVNTQFGWDNALMDVCKRHFYYTEYYQIYKKVRHLLLIAALGSLNEDMTTLQTIRSAIAKLKNENTTSNPT